LRRGVFGERERLKMMQDAATGKQVGAALPQLSRGTAAQDKTPARLVRIVKRLHGVEDGGDGLRLVNEDKLRCFPARQRQTLAGEQSGIGEVPVAFLRRGEIDDKGVVRQKRSEQRGFPRLPCAEQNVNVGALQFFAERGGEPAVLKGCVGCLHNECLHN
jgi:hypothetical protein